MAVPRRLPLAALAFTALLAAQLLVNPAIQSLPDVEAATIPAAGKFGQSGPRVWSTYDLSTYANTTGACGCEPTLGVNWLQGGGEDVLYNAGNTVACVHFKPLVSAGVPPVARVDNCSTPIQPLPNQDPLLFTDFDGGRTWVAQLQVAIYSYAPYVDVAPPVTPICEPLLPVAGPVWGVAALAGVNQPSCLITGCSAMVYTDFYDAKSPITGELEWLPVADACSLPGWDHQSVGAGPWAHPAPQWAPSTQCKHIQECEELCAETGDIGGVPCTPAASRAVYYCAQAGSPVCWISYDGGVTFLPAAGQENLQDASEGRCIGIHGHLRISRAYKVEDTNTNDGPHPGHVYLPDKSCMEGSICRTINAMDPACRTGFMLSTDNGLSWDVRLRPDELGYPNMAGAGADCSNQPDMDLLPGWFDPSIAPSLDHGWIYLGQGENDGPASGSHAGAYIAMSKTNGVTWEDVGTGNGACPGTKYFNVGALAGVKQAAFAEVIAGDDDRAAFAFLGSTTSDATYGNACGGAGSAHQWDLYVAVTYDAGKTWTVDKVTKDLVQRGYIWAQGFSNPPSTCRNLLDFNDIVTDAKGRIIAAYSDGCKGTCITGGSSGGAAASIARQDTGRGLLAKYDIPDPVPEPLPETESGPGAGGPKELAPAPDGATDTGDKDGDSVVDHKDNCPLASNIDQADTDLDSHGNACDGDDDGDGIPDGADDCPLAANPYQRDANADGVGDACDDDADGDAVLNAVDNCWVMTNADQADMDLDGEGDACDADRDGDGVPNGSDVYPDDKTRWGSAVAPSQTQVAARPVNRIAAPEPASSGPALLIGGSVVVLGLLALTLLMVRRRKE